TRISPIFFRMSLAIWTMPLFYFDFSLSALESLFQILDVAGVLDGVLERQVARLVDLVQRLVHGLHTHLSRHLDDGVYLMGLVFADQRANSGVREHDLRRQDAALPVRLRDQ